MPKLIFDITMSLDGYVAGRDPPLGKGGTRLHEWGLVTAAALARGETGRAGPCRRRAS